MKNEEMRITMSIATTVVDDTLRDAVQSQLEWANDVDASMIGVTAHDGVITLTGYVRTYAEKLHAERCARRVYGVKAVANDVLVKLSVDRIDPDIARDAVEALRGREGVPPGIEVTVRYGHISLTGMVEWPHQRVAAERAVRYLRGVKGVANHLVIKPLVAPKDAEKRIVTALHREADVEARRVHVVAIGAKVTLTGGVRSWTERQEAERAAWNTAGVSSVENLIAIVP
jgi:osmotically-inducible protein OsmY